MYIYVSIHMPNAAQIIRNRCIILDLIRQKRQLLDRDLFDGPNDDCFHYFKKCFSTLAVRSICSHSAGLEVSVLQS